MNWTRAQLKGNAWLMVKKNWLSCVIVSLIVGLFAGTHSLNYKISDSDMEQIVSNLGGDWAGWIMRFLPAVVGVTVIVAALSILLDILVGKPLKVGGARFYLHNIHSKGEVGDLAFPFQNAYTNVVVTSFVTDLIIFLWTLCLVIPGIIKSYEYFLVPYLLADNPELDQKEARNLSSAMMEGEKMNAFILALSFILWNFLSSITLGLAGILWVNPYIDATYAELYTAIKTRWEEEHGPINY